MTEIAFPHQENGSFYAVKFSFWSCLFFLLCLGEETDKLCKLARAPPEIFILELNSATKVEFFY